MRLYVAGGSSELDRVEAFICVVRELGHEVTYLWPVDVRNAAKKGLRDADLSDAEARCFAERDMAGVEDAELLILLAPERGIGAWVELGIALGRGIPVIVAGEHRRASIFTRLADVVCEHDSDAAALLASYPAEVRA